MLKLSIQGFELAFNLNILLGQSKYTSKLRKFEPFFYKINTYLQKATTCIGLQAEEIFSVNIKYNFSILGWFLRFFFCYFPKLQLLVIKKIEIKFTALLFYLCLISKKVPQIFKILFQTGNINIFVLRGIFFSRYVQLKSFFQQWNLRHNLVEKLSKFNVGKY